MRESVIKVVDSRTLPVLVFAAICLLYLSTVSNQLGEFNGDTAYYLLLGKSIAEGNIYIDPVIPGEFPHTKYPFFYPLLLAPLIALKGMDMMWIRVFVALIAALSVAAWYGYFRETAGRRAALGLAVLFAVHPYQENFVTRTLSETPYLLFTGLCFFAYARFVKSGRNRTCLAVIVLAVVSYFTRTAGVALFAGIVASLLFHRHLRSKQIWRMPAWMPALLAFAAAFALWSAYVFFNPSPLLSYFQEMGSIVHPGDSFDIPGFAEKVFINVDYHLGQTFKNVFVFVPASAIAGLALFGFFVYGALRGAGEEGLMPAFYVLLYLVMIMLWPTFVDFRFVYPLLPLLLLFGYRALELPASRLKKAGPALPAAFFIVLLSCYTFQTGRTVSAQHGPDPYPPRPTTMFGHKIEKPVVDWSDTAYAYKTPKNMFAVGEFLVLLEIIKKTFPENVVISSDMPANTTFITGRNAVRSPAYPSPAESLEYLESWQVNYLIVDRFSQNTARCVVPLLKQYPDRFRKIIGEKGKLGPAVYRFLPPEQTD